MRQQWLRWGRRDQLEMRVATAGLLIRERKAVGPRMVTRDIGEAVVLGRVMVREPVAHLRKEEGQSHDQG